MGLETVERWSGPLLLFGGALLVVVAVIHPLGITSQFVEQPLWVPAHFLEYGGFITILFGLVGWYSRFSASIGKLGTAGFVIAFFGNATAAGVPLWSDALLQPYIAANAPSLEDALYSNFGFLTVFLIGALVFFLGYVMFTFAVVRARVLPSWDSWLVVLLIAGFWVFFLGGPIAFIFANIGEALIGLSFAGWGYAIMSAPTRARSSERPHVR